MQSRLIQQGEQRTYALIFETGDEVASALLEFAQRNRLGGSHFTAIGAFSDVTLGYFDWEKKEYLKNPIREQVEVVSLVGDIALQDGEPKVHAHVVVGKRDGSAWGGHLLEAHVRPTLEVILEESPAHLRKTYDPESGLALIDPAVSQGKAA
jgi:hypothetical protein